MRSDVSQLAELVARVDAGELAIEVAQRLPLADLATVHARAAGRFARIAELTARPRAETWPSDCVPTRRRSAPRLPPETWSARPS
ncbi:hypothetical protein ACWGH2_36350 [Streptomyces sp. NPDC054871]